MGRNQTETAIARTINFMAINILVVNFPTLQTTLPNVPVPPLESAALLKYLMKYEP